VRQATLAELFSGKVSPLATSLVGWVVGEERSRDLVDILDEVVSKLAAEHRQSVAEVRVAEPLDEGRVEALRAGISRTVGRDVAVKVVIDPSVIGGVVTRVDDIVIDGTIGHRLAQMRRAVGAPG
jgi:F-type H+-transporting ATPase subunit delta